MTDPWNESDGPKEVESTKAGGMDPKTWVWVILLVGALWLTQGGGGGEKTTATPGGVSVAGQADGPLAEGLLMRVAIPEEGRSLVEEVSLEIGPLSFREGLTARIELRKGATLYPGPADEGEVGVLASIDDFDIKVLWWDDLAPEPADLLGMVRMMGFDLQPILDALIGSEFGYTLTSRGAFLGMDPEKAAAVAQRVSAAAGYPLPEEELSKMVETLEESKWELRENREEMLAFLDEAGATGAFPFLEGFFPEDVVTGESRWGWELSDLMEVVEGLGKMGQEGVEAELEASWGEFAVLASLLPDFGWSLVPVRVEGAFLVLAFEAHGEWDFEEMIAEAERLAEEIKDLPSPGTDEVFPLHLALKGNGEVMIEIATGIPHAMEIDLVLQIDGVSPAGLEGLIEEGTEVSFPVHLHSKLSPAA